MEVQPAHVDQIRRARDGRMVLIDGDAGGVAQDLQRIDPSLKVRFAENGRPPFWAVYHESEDGRTTYLVLTATATQTVSGTWSGLDQRIVKRIEKIGHSDYDYADEIERANLAAYQSRRAGFREKVGGPAEEMAHAIRKDLGVKKTAFISKEIK